MDIETVKAAEKTQNPHFYAAFREADKLLKDFGYSFTREQLATINTLAAFFLDELEVCNECGERNCKQHEA